MKLFLTSTLGAHESLEEGKIPAAIQNPNGLDRLLRESLPEKVRLLILSSDPDNHAQNDFYAALDAEGLRLSGVNVVASALCDGRNPEALQELLTQSDMVILSGGHVPTENAFFARIGLKEALRSYDGVVVGISAGSMNASKLVYAQPELDGEALDPAYQRWIPGLGLTELRLVPHWQEVREMTLDGLRILEDISLPDSRVHPFYAIPDGSFFLCEDGGAVLYGEGWLLENGAERRILREGERLRVL